MEGGLGGICCSIIFVFLTPIPLLVYCDVCGLAAGGGFFLFFFGNRGWGCILIWENTMMGSVFRKKSGRKLVVRVCCKLQPERGVSYQGLAPQLITRRANSTLPA